MENSNQQRIKEITERLETGIRELYESDRYRSYLSTMSRFHKYSVNNTLLIHLQMPNATLVAGFNTWKNKFGRYVKRGEKGIQVIAPATSQRNVREPALDKDTKEPILDAAGNAVMEEHAVRITRFKPVTVFDVSQTDGKPLPKLAQTLNGSVEQYDAFLEALRRSAPVTIEFEAMELGTDGYFSADQQRIAIREGMSQVQTISAVLHEVAHSKLHDYDRLVDAGPPHKKDRRTEEVEAESISYSVCQYYGIETAENSLGYIASWSKGKELKELKASLEAIQKTASVLIDDIDRNFAEICKERGIDMERSEEGEEKNAPAKEPEPVDAEPVQAQAEDPEALADPPDPYLAYANALCDHAEELYRAGLIPPPFDTKEKFVRDYAALIRIDISHCKAVLDDFAEMSGYPTPESLYQQFEALKERWTRGLTYQMTVSPVDPGIGYISSYRPDGSIYELGLFSGPKMLCERALSEMKEGLLSVEAIRHLDATTYYGSLDALYQLGDTHLLHVQLTEDGYHYDAFALASGEKEKSGEITLASTIHHDTKTLMDAAVFEICLREGIDPVSWEECPMNRLEELQAGDTQPVKLDEYPMPDGALPIDALAEAGCVDPEGLIPMCKDQAKELFAEGFTIFVIDEDGEPMMCFDEADVAGADTQIFAVEKFEWEKSQEFRVTAHDWRIEHQAEREAAFLQYPGDAFAIYQVRDNSPQHRDRLFTDLDSLRQHGMTPSREHYDLIYTGSLADHPSVTSPEAAYRVFNLEHPHDFAGHSLSVSDIVAFRHNGVVTYHYCDSCGFAEIPDFQKPENYLKNAEMAMEDDYGMIDGIINNGPKDHGPTKQEPSQPEAQKPRPAKSDVPREKKSEPPSLLARLRIKQEEVEEQKRQKAQIAEICASIS